MAQAIHRGPGQGETLLIGRGGDYVTAKAAGEETGGLFTAYEVLSSPGFGPPLHTHSWQEFFYVLEGEFTFTSVTDGELREVVAGPGSSFLIPARVPHAFRNSSSGYSRLLIVDQPVGIEPFFRDVGVTVAKPGAEPDEEGFDPSLMAEVLPRFGVEIVAGPAVEHA